jgi:hypothetical protein
MFVLKFATSVATLFVTLSIAARHEKAGSQPNRPQLCPLLKDASPSNQVFVSEGELKYRHTATWLLIFSFLVAIILQRHSEIFLLIRNGTSHHRQWQQHFHGAHRRHGGSCTRQRWRQGCCRLKAVACRRQCRLELRRPWMAQLQALQGRRHTL